MDLRGLTAPRLVPRAAPTHAAPDDGYLPPIVTQVAPARPAPSLHPLLEATSVAVVGASERRGSVGDVTVRQLLDGGFPGSVYPVNPRYETIHDLPAFASMEEIPEPVDLAVLALANDRLETAMADVVASGARSATIFASCHGRAGDGSRLRDRLAAIASEAGIPVCGGNGMGFVNVERSLRICGFHQPEDLAAGAVTFLSHSGSLFSAMLHNRRDLRFNLVVSSGIELTTTMDRYLEYALALESTAAVALFLETIRDPEGFSAQLAAAEAADIPIVALKVGSSEHGRRAVLTHSEGLAGDDGAYEALFDAYGVARVGSMDELCDTVELLSGRRASAGGLGVVHDSGGERTLMIDTAAALGVPLPAIGSGTRARIAAVLDPGLDPENPVDAWGTGRAADEVFTECLDALAADPEIGAVAFSVDLTVEEDPEEAYSRVPIAVASRTEKPVALLANLGLSVDPIQARALRDGGVPVLHGTTTGLSAVRHLLDRRDHRSLCGPEPRRTEARVTAAVAGEMDALRTVAAYGIPVPRMVAAASGDEAADAAESIGFPVVLKSARPGLVHKTEAGGVVLGLTSAQDVRAAHAAMERALGPEAIVAATARRGAEFALGMVRDEQFGPVLVVAGGGLLVEVVADRVTALPRLDAPRVRRMLGRLTSARLLDGVRGGPRLDSEALVDAIVRFSELAVDAAVSYRAIDINPIIVHEQGATAVDAVFVEDLP